MRLRLADETRIAPHCINIDFRIHFAYFTSISHLHIYTTLRVIHRPLFSLFLFINYHFIVIVPSLHVGSSVVCCCSIIITLVMDA